MPAGPKGPFCQSCGMPMDKTADFGTENNGSRSTEYCSYCYASGSFTTPNITMPAMLELCVRGMAKNGVMPEAEARKLMAGVLPQLKRWRQPAVAAVR